MGKSMLVTLVLQIDPQDPIIEELRRYGKMMRHEIYRICGVFQKQQCTFAYPYRYMNDSLAWASRELLIKQAITLYDKRKEDPKAKLDFIAIWAKQSYRLLYEESLLILNLGGGQRKREMMIPFVLGEGSTLANKELWGEVKLREMQHQWFADVLRG